jgi:ribosomal protein S10
MNLPFAIKKDAFTQLFNEKGFSMLEKFSTVEDIKEYVSNVVAKVTGKSPPAPKTKTETKKETPNVTKEQYENFQDIKHQLDSLNKALAQMSSTMEHFEKATEALNTIGKSAMPSPSTAMATKREHDSKNTIEGFENGRFHYASIY